MLRPTRVFVHFSPTRQELVVLGARAATRCVHTDPAETPAAWSASVAAFQARLREWVIELGLRRAPAVVLYWSPDLSVSVQACPAAARDTRATRAALLAHGESTPLDADTNPVDAAFLHRDRASSRTPDGIERPAQLHTLVASDRAGHAGAVASAVRSAGLIPAQLVPIAGASIVAATAQLRRSADEGGVHAVLWIGEQNSILVAGDRDRLLLLRQLPLGTESMVEALARPIRSGDGGTQCVLLDRATARRRLASRGIPDPSGPPDPDALDPALALPLLQPVLQRLSLEARNSLRFGLGAEDRTTLRTHLAGPGAAIRGLEHALRFEEEPPRSIPHDPADLRRAGASAGLTLLPRKDLETMQGRFLRRALYAGVASAGLGIASDALMSWKALEDQDAIVRMVSAPAAGADASRAALSRAASIQARVADARRRLGIAMQDVPEWGALLSHLADTTPEGIVLSSLECRRDADAWTCRVAGVLDSESETEAARTLRTYLGALADVPAVAHARLGATHRTAAGAGDRTAFEIVLSLVPLPRAREPVLDARVVEAQLPQGETP
jgi:Tfp pilus assembly protein PilN